MGVLEEIKVAGTPAIEQLTAEFDRRMERSSFADQFERIEAARSALLGVETLDGIERVLTGTSSVIRKNVVNASLSLTAMSHRSNKSVAQLLKAAEKSLKEEGVKEAL